MIEQCQKDCEINSYIKKTHENIKKCISFKNAYEFERAEGNKIIENLKIEFNRNPAIPVEIIILYGDINFTSIKNLDKTRPKAVM